MSNAYKVYQMEFGVCVCVKKGEDVFGGKKTKYKVNVVASERQSAKINMNDDGDIQGNRQI